jgi:hypothetical protein
LLRVTSLTLLSLLAAAGIHAHTLDSPTFKNICAPAYLPDGGLQLDRAALDDLAHLNVDMIRMEFIGDHDNQRTINYEAYDHIVDEAGKRGISMMGLVAYQSFPVVYNDRSEWSHPSFRQRFVNRLSEIVRHYHDREFPIRHWEIWNQPDRNDPDFNVRIEPQHYASMLVDSYLAIKAIDPHATVILGGISPRGHQYETNYLREVYESPAIQAYRKERGRSPFDVVAVHPHQYNYSDINPHLGDLLIERVKSVMNEFGDSGMKVWLTELGWNSRVVGLRDQAAFLRQSYQLLASLRDPAFPDADPFVERYFWFQYQNYGEVQDWGLITNDRQTRKAAYFAFRDLTATGPVPGSMLPGERPPAWQADSDQGLPVQVAQDDLLTGLVPEIISGGLHEAATGTLASLTNGLFDEDVLTLLLGDYHHPSLHLRYTFEQPVDIVEFRSFAAHRRDWGNRAWQNIDIRINGRHGIDELTTGPFGQTSPHPDGAVSVVRWTPSDDQQYVARDVSILDIIYYPVSHTDHYTFVDPWHPISDPKSTLQDQIRDSDGIARAYVASLLKEIDVIGHASPMAHPHGGNEP